MGHTILLSSRHLQLGDLIVHVEQGGARRGAQADCRRSDLQFGPRPCVGVEAVAGNERTIRLGDDPFVFARRCKAHRTLNVGEARDARRRICDGVSHAKRKPRACEHGQHVHQFSDRGHVFPHG